MMEGRGGNKISNQLQVSSLDSILQLPAGEVFAKERLMPAANISHCPLSKMLIYTAFGREVGKQMSPSSGLKDITLLHNLPYKTASSEEIFFASGILYHGGFLCYYFSPYRTDTPRPPAAPIPLIAVSPVT